MGKARRKKEESHQEAAHKDAILAPWASIPPPVLLAGLILVVAGMVVCAHWPVLAAGAVSFDDNYYLADNPRVQYPGWSSVGQVFGEVFRPYAPGYYEPLAVVSLMLDWAQGGRLNHLRPFHRTSLALHVANTGLIIVLLYLLFRQPWVAAMAGLLFGVHPLTVEPIALVAQRKVLLAAFFSLWCLILYVQYARAGRLRFLVAALVAYGLALLSKPTSTPLPVLLLLLDFWPLRRLRFWSAASPGPQAVSERPHSIGRPVLEKLPFFVLGGVSAVITLISCSRTAGITLPGESSVVRISLTIAYLVAFYFSKIVWPAHLSSVYPLPSPFAVTNPLVILGVLSTGVLCVAMVYSLRWTRALLTSVLFFLVAVFPTMGAVGYTWVTGADKHVYLPAVGLLLLLASCLAWLWGRGPQASSTRRRCVVAVIVLTLCGAEVAATRGYLDRWRDSERLFQYMLKLSPDVAAVHNNLANALIEGGKVEDAVRHYSRAVELDPQCAEAIFNLGNILAAQGRLDEAIRQYTAALQVRPAYPEAHINLGAALFGRGRVDEAAGEYAEAIRLRPTFAEAHYNLARTRARQGRFDEAVRSYRDAIAVRPDWAAPHKALGILFEGQGKAEAALREYEAALRLNPQDHEVRDRLGEISHGPRTSTRP